MPRNCTVRRAFTGHRIGESHPRAQLTSDDVKLMRQLHEEHKIGYGTLADKFECSPWTARDICKYRTRVYD